MQNKNMRNLLMAAVGAYLVYTGVTLVMDVQKGQPENQTIFIVCGIVFAILGLITVVMNLKTYIDAMKEAFTATSSEEEEQDVYEEEAPVTEHAVSRKKDTVIIDLAGAEELEPEVTIEEAEELEEDSREQEETVESEEEGEAE